MTLLSYVPVTVGKSTANKCSWSRRMLRFDILTKCYIVKTVMVIGAVLAQNAHKNGIWKGFEKMARTIFSNRRDDFDESS